MTTSEGRGLACPKSAAELLDLYFLDLRCHLLEASSCLDRVERGEGGAEAMKDSRIEQVMQALEMMRKPGTDRARRFLEIFSEEG
jgi:hypothetical protein